MDTHLPCSKKRVDGHPVLGEGTGLVHAQHGRRTERFYRGNLPGQYIFLGDPPRTKRKEDGQDYGEFFRKDCHGKGDPCKEPLDPVTPAQAVHDNDNRTQ